MATLYELKGDYLRLLEMAEDPDTDEEVLADTLESLDYEIEEKADAYVAVIGELNADVEKIDAEIKRLTARKKTISGNADRIKQNLQDTMTAIGKKKIKTALHTISVVKNGGKVPLVIDSIDIEELPDIFVNVEKSINKNIIREYLEKGGELGYARFGEQGYHLTIR